MSDQCLSEFGTVGSKTKALHDASGWAKALLSHFHQGWGDNKISARAKASRSTGVSESQLQRLTTPSKFEEMRDVSGEVYRRLKAAYEKHCELHEAAAEQCRVERSRIINAGTESMDHARF